MERPRKKVARFSIRLSPDDKALISQIAECNNISESDLISYLLRDFVNQGGKTITTEVKLKMPTVPHTEREH